MRNEAGCGTHLPNLLHPRVFRPVIRRPLHLNVGDTLEPSILQLRLVLLNWDKWSPALRKDLVDVVTPSLHGRGGRHGTIVTVQLGFHLHHFYPSAGFECVVGLFVEVGVVADGADQMAVVDEIEAVVSPGPA